MRVKLWVGYTQNYGMSAVETEVFLHLRMPKPQSATPFYIILVLYDVSEDT
jgi:hypothetical protein